MIKICQKFLFFGIIFTAVFLVSSARAQSDYNVYGWAWSGNIGWISFNCLNDYNGDGKRENHCDGVNPKTAEGSSYVSYGVDIDPNNGNFSGYAWSDNIGWISFENNDVSGCPFSPCRAKFDSKTGEVSGWARALSASDGWEGWIRLRGSWNNGVSINSNVSPAEFEGWAWSDKVIGWISFNCSNSAGSCAASNYKVMTDFSSKNQLPEAVSLEFSQGDYCASPSRPPVFLNWTFQDSDPGDSQFFYEVKVYDSKGKLADNSGKVNTQGLSGPNYTYIPKLSYGNETYSWTLKVSDGKSWSDQIQGGNFQVYQKWPDPDFVWCPEKPSPGQLVQFCSVFEADLCEKGAETCSDMKNGEDLTFCEAGCVSWLWDFGDNVSSDKKNPNHIYSGPSVNYEVKLTVTDSQGNSCPVSKNLKGLTLPFWREIAPF